MAEKQTVIFRADGSKKYGFGHLMRSCVLAEELKKIGYEAHFISADADETVSSFLDNRNIKFDSIETSASGNGAVRHLAIMRELGSSLAILDSYGVDDAYRLYLKENGIRIAVIDDLCAHYSHADMVINHNPSAEADRYGDFSGKLLLGPEYALIDSKYGELKEKMLNVKELRIVVTLGGTDARNQTERILRLLDRLEEALHITVVAGYYSETGIPANMKHPCEVITRTDNMAGLIESCDAAVTAGGITCMEFACAGRPFLIVVTDEHQFENARKYHYAGAAVYAGRVWKKNDAELLSAFRSFFEETSKWKLMGYAGRKLIDGKGAERTAAEVSKLFKRKR